MDQLSSSLEVWFKQEWASKKKTQGELLAEDYNSSLRENIRDIVYKMDDGFANQEDIENAEQCVCEMNACLRSAHELYLYGQERNIDFRDNQNMLTAFNFVKNYEKGTYDTHHGQLCEHLQEKILKSTEL